MKRRLALSGFAIALLVAAWSFHWRLDAAAQQERLRASLQLSGPGTEVTIGAAGLKLLPIPHIGFKALSMQDAASGIRAIAPGGVAAIRPLALLAGRVEFGDIRVNGARIILDGRSAPAGRGLVDLLEALRATAWSQRISLTDSEIALMRADAPATTLTALNASWRGAESPGRRTLTAKFTLRGKEVNLEVQDNPQGRSGRGQRIEVRSPDINLRMALPLEAEAPGTISLAMGNVGQFLGWLGQGSPLGKAIGKFGIEGKLVRQTGAWSINEARLDVDGQKLEGALSWDTRRPRPLLTGTLAGSTFDLGALLIRLSGAQLDRPDMQDWGFEPAEIDAGLPQGTRSFGHDLDLRLSLEKAMIGRTVLEEAAAQLLVSPSRVDLSLAQAQMHKGTVKARYAVTRNANGAESRLQFGIDKVDLAPLTQELAGTRRLAGTGTGQLVLEGTGTNLKSLVRNATGRASLSIRQGEVQGFALAETVRRLERQPLLALRDWRSGRSSFETAQFAGPIAHGVLDLTEGTVTAAGFGLTLGGRISLADQTLALRGILSAPGGRGLQVPFDIDGPWQSPEVKPKFNPAILQRTGSETPPAR